MISSRPELQKAISPINSKVSGKSIDFSEVQPKNAPSSMLFKSRDSTTRLKAVQFRNAAALTWRKEWGNITSSRAVHSAKASGPML